MSNVSSRFFTGNVLDGLDTFYNQFDLVHLRMVVVHVSVLISDEPSVV